MTAENDSWDGTDVEPGHPRNTPEKQEAEPAELDAYVLRYQQEPNCQDG